MGLTQEARAEFEHLAANDFTDLPRDALWLICMAYLTEVCAFLADAAGAAALYRLLLPYGKCIVSERGGVACYGSASRYWGLLAGTMSRWEEAAQHFEDALAMNARMGAKPWLAHTQHEYAEMLLARGQPGDQRRLTNKQWERRKLLLSQKPRTGRPAHDHRTILNGIWWILRTGAPWRDLPERYGLWRTVASRFYRWQKAGIWQRLLAAVQQQADAAGRIN